MTEREKQEIINLVHRTVLGFFDPSLDEERYLTKAEKTLLEVSKAICNGIKEMPTTAELPSCVLDEETSNALMNIILKGVDLDDSPIGGFHDD